MTDTFDILVTLSTFAEYSEQPLRLLEASGLTFRINQSGKRMTPEEVVSQGSGCRAVIAGVEKYSAEVLAAMPLLKCISRVGVGIDSIDQAECKKRGIAILNTPDEPAVAVAELTLAMILGLLRRFPQVSPLTCARKWQRVPGNLLSGKIVGLIGLGRIGRKVTGLLQPFGVRVIACDPAADAVWAENHQVELVELGRLLEQADILTIHASGGGAPLKIGRDEIGRMKDGAILINVARGDMIDDAALAEALSSGKIAGAGLDVYPREPYNGPLCDTDKVILTPHQATLTVETRVAMETHAVRNATDYLTNLPK